VRYCRQQHSEFIAADSRNQVLRAQACLEPDRDLFKEHIAAVVAEGFVDFFEVVQVNE